MYRLSDFRKFSRILSSYSDCIVKLLKLPPKPSSKLNLLKIVYPDTSVQPLSYFISLGLAAANSTSTETELVQATWGIAIATIGSFVVLACITVYYSSRQSKAQDILNKINGMAQIRRMIQDQIDRGYLKNMKDYHGTFKTHNEKAIFSNEEKFHQENLTPAIIEQAYAVEDAFEDASRIVNNHLVDYDEFSRQYGSFFREYWAILREDIEYKRIKNKGAYRNFSDLAERIGKETS